MTAGDIKAPKNSKKMENDAGEAGATQDFERKIDPRRPPKPVPNPTVDRCCSKGTPNKEPIDDLL